MEIKKSPRADLENKKSIFWEIGLMLALGIVFLAFEWKVAVPEPSDFITVSEIPMDIEMVPVTQLNQLPPPPPPAMIKPFDLLEIVDEPDALTDDVELVNADDDTENPTLSLDNLNYEPVETDEILPFLPAEDMPVFPGNVQKWVAQNVKYPQIAVENGIEGKVYIQFVIEKDGSVSNITVVRGVDAMIDKEAVRVISSMPKWQPGKQRGKAVRVSYTIPISFTLNQ